MHQTGSGFRTHDSSGAPSSAESATESACKCKARSLSSFNFSSERIVKVRPDRLVLSRCDLLRQGVAGCHEVFRICRDLSLSAHGRPYARHTSTPDSTPHSELGFAFQGRPFEHPPLSGSWRYRIRNLKESGTKTRVPF